FERSPLPDLPVHLRNRILAFDDAEQAEQVWKSIFERTVEREYAPGQLLSSRSLIIFTGDFEIALQQIEHRKICRRLAVGDREGFQHHPARLILDFELVEQARLAGARLRHRRYNLSMAGDCTIGGGLHRVHLALA